MADIALSSLSRNTLLALSQKKTPPVSSSNISSNKSITAGVPDRVSVSPEALARLNAEKTSMHALPQGLGKLSLAAVNPESASQQAEKNNADALPQGLGKLTLADLNAEGANLVSLQTRQQLGTQSLSLANQQQQSLLRLFA